MTKIISIINNKGGVLKTTLAVEVASSLARNFEKKVLIIDLDSQGDVSSAFGINAEMYKNTIQDIIDPDEGSENYKTSVFNLLNLYKNPSNYLEGVPDNLTNHYEKKYNDLIKIGGGDKIDIIPSNSSLMSFEINLAVSTNNIGKRKLLNLLNSLDGIYDFIIVDTPPNPGLIQLNALAGSDWAIIPTQLEEYSIKGMGNLQKIIQQAKTLQNNISSNKNIEIKMIVPTMFNPRGKNDKAYWEALNSLPIFNKNLLSMEEGIKRSKQSSNSVTERRLPITLSNKLSSDIKYKYSELAGKLVK